MCFHCTDSDRTNIAQISEWTLHPLFTTTSIYLYKDMASQSKIPLSKVYRSQQLVTPNLQNSCVCKLLEIDILTFFADNAAYTNMLGGNIE